MKHTKLATFVAVAAGLITLNATAGATIVESTTVDGTTITKTIDNTGTHIIVVDESAGTAGTGRTPVKDGSAPYALHAQTVGASLTSSTAGTGSHAIDGAAPYKMHADAVGASLSTASTTTSPASDDLTGTAGTGDTGTAATGEHAGDDGAAGASGKQYDQQQLTTAKYDAANSTASTTEPTATESNDGAASASGKQFGQQQLTADKYASATSTASTTEPKSDEQTGSTASTGTIPASVITSATRPAATAPATDSRMAAADKEIAEGKAAQKAANARLARDESAQRATDARLDQLSRHTASETARLDRRIDETNDRAAAAGAAGIAHADIPQVEKGDLFAVGAAIGGYDDQQAVAVGMSFHATENSVVKLSVSDDSQQNFGYGAGVSYSFR